jgi:hypothetical protein
MASKGKGAHAPRLNPKDQEKMEKACSQLLVRMGVNEDKPGMGIIQLLT